MGFNRKKFLGSLFLLFVIFVLIQVLRGSFAVEEKLLRRQMRESVQQQFPDAYQKVQAAFGLQEFTLPTVKPQKNRGEREGGSCSWAG